MLVKLDKFETDYIILDKQINFGETLALFASDGENYTWLPDYGLSCNDCQFPVLTAQNSITYTATFNKDVCKINNIFKIKVIPFIPNTITPDNNDVNDYFVIDGIEPKSKLTISDRFGNIVFKTNDYKNNWDATINDDCLPIDTYWYTLKMPSTEEVITGFIYVYY